MSRLDVDTIRHDQATRWLRHGQGMLQEASDQSTAHQELSELTKLLRRARLVLESATMQYTKDQGLDKPTNNKQQTIASAIQTRCKSEHDKCMIQEALEEQKAAQKVAQKSRGRQAEVDSDGEWEV
jgi:glucosamine 6-phosphate synthetase-like amidotransferase/phosphosugar isomerase protein